MYASMEIIKNYPRGTAVFRSSAIKVVLFHLELKMNPKINTLCSAY